MNSRRLSIVDNLYAIGTILVVFGHSHPSDWTLFGNTTYDYIIKFVYIFHMPLFFFIAGFLFANSKSIERESFGKWIGSKALKFLVPYVILSAVALIPKYYLENRSFGGMAKYVLRSIFEPRSGIWGHFWFLPVLLIIYLIFGLLRKFVIKKMSIPVVLILIAVCTALYFMPYGTNWIGVNDIKNFMVFFAVGILVNKLIKDKEKMTLPKSIAVLCIAAGFALSIWLYIKFYHNDIVMFAAAYIMIFVVWNIAGLLGENKACRFISDNIFTIYIFSWPIQAVVMYLCTRIGLSWQITSACMFVFGLIGPMLIAVIYKKQNLIKNRFTDLLIGQK